MMALMSAAGVTSKAGLRTLMPSGASALVADVRDLARGALLDGDLAAGRRLEVDRRHRRGDEERDVVRARVQRQAVGADLVGGVAVGGDAIGADDDRLDLSALHHVRGHVVGDERDVDAALVQLPRGQPRALQERARLVGEDVDAALLLVRGADDAERGAVAAGGQRAGVAVREHAALRQERRAVLADLEAHEHVHRVQRCARANRAA